MQKKLFKHGGSYAVDLPISFVRELDPKTVLIERQADRIVIAPKRELDTIEQEPEFAAFAAALLRDALRRPSKLRDAKEVWDKEWDELLKGVPRGED
ncbi:MAG: hypothetical protein A2X36_09900 [Elusimicrobia bacterium GWA2_69_24]|nr:MAG: hypothetical protein A2X36_09900 [Elusimicrobia bacterium GWA2_69_24]HBL17587.1 hypothetical protein [Elusimicrobiota bacterium]